MINSEMMDSGDSLYYKDHENKSRHLKKDKSLSKQEKGDEPVGKTRKSHRTVSNDKDKPKVEISLLLVGDKEDRKIMRNETNKKRVENENSNFKTPVLNGKRTPENEIYKIESILKNSNQRSELTKEGVRFDKNIKTIDKENVGVKEKKDKSKKEPKEQTKHKSSSRSRDNEEKSNYQLTGERRKGGNKVHTDKPKTEYSEKREKSNDQLKSKIRTKDKSDLIVFESPDENEGNERKNEQHRERKSKKKNRKAVVDSAVVLCPEKKKSKKSRRVEEDINVVSETNAKTDHGDKESKHKRDKKEHKNKEHKKKHNPRESGDDQIDRQLNKLENDRFKEPENGRSKIQERDRNEINLSQVPESRTHERDKHEKNEGGENKGKSKKSKRKHRTDNYESEKDKLNQKEPSDGMKIEKKAKFECLKDEDEKSSDSSFVKEFPLKRGKDLSSVDTINKGSNKEETTEINLKSDKYIKLFNKEDVLMKGMQDITVKELYLMENLKDYELRLSEQFLKKIKKKRQEQQSTSDNINGRPLTEKSTIPPITNLPVCKLPSVKEIFKISNLADYEKTYKEMQDRKKKKYTDTRGDVDFGFSPSLGRKKLNKFFLESKEENSNIKDKADPSTKSSQWLLKNYPRAAVKNEGGGEDMICNVSLIYANENDKPADTEKKHEIGDARAPNNATEINLGFRTASKTGLREVSSCSNRIQKNEIYLKMCQKFHTDIREESKKLLQNLAGNKNVRISIKDNSVQSIKKKPSLSSSEGLGTMKNYDYVLLKKPKRDLGDSSSVFPWNLAHSNNVKGYFENSSSVRAFDKNLNKNAGVFIKNNCKPNSPPPENLFDLNTNQESDPLRSQQNFAQSSVDYDLNSSLSMFDRIKDTSVANNISLRNPGDLDLLKRCEVSREHPDIDILRKRDKTKSKIDESRGSCFHRSSTLERIINEIEDFPEKDTNPSCNVLRESKFENRLNKFSEIEKSNNVLLSYISHVNDNNQKRDKNRNDVDRDEKKCNDRLTKNKKLVPNRRKCRDSLSCLKYIDYLEQSHLNGSFISRDVEVDRPCAGNCKSCAGMDTASTERNQKPRTNVLEASLQSASTAFKCDLKAEQRENVINTKLVISDPSKRSNILQIQFCGKLNINFNKDNIELGSVDGNQKPLEIKYTDGQTGGEKKLEISRTKNNPEDLLSLNASDCLPGQNSSEECLNKNISLSSSGQSENSLSNYRSGSNSSVVCRGKRDGSLSRDKKSKLLANEEALKNQMEEAITTEIKTSQSRDKPNVEKVDLPDNAGSMIRQISCMQVNSTTKTFTTGGERGNLATENTDNSDKPLLTSGKRSNSLSATSIEILEKTPNLIDHSVQDEKSKPDIEQLNTSYSQSKLDLHKENKSEESKTANENELFVENENSCSVVQEKLDLEKTPSNHDAFVQTVVDQDSDSAVFNELNVLCCDVETCTSSTFEIKKCEMSSKRIIPEGSAYSAIKNGEESCSYSSTNGTSEGTDKTSAENTSKDVSNSSSEVIAPLNKTNTSSLQIDFTRERNKEDNISPKMPLPHFQKNDSPSILKIPSPKGTGLNNRVMETNESGFVSQSSYDVVNGKGSPLHQSRSRDRNGYAPRIDKADRENNDKNQLEKKKLLLSRSEEDAFKYLLLKGIGRTSVEDQLSTKSVAEFTECLSDPKTMFSAIRKRLETFKSKAGDSKSISGQKRTNSSKQRKFSPIENRTKKFALQRECPNCSVCTCGKLNPFVGYWDTQRNADDNFPRDQMPRAESHKPANQKHYRQDSVINNSTGHSICEYDMSEDVLYGLQSLFENSSNLSLNSKNPIINQCSSANREQEAFVHRVAEQKQLSGNAGAKNAALSQSSRKLYHREFSNHYDQKQFIDDMLWTESVQCNHCNKRNFSENLTRCCLPHKHYSSEPVQNKSADFRPSERLSFTNHERQIFSNDTFHHNNPNNRQYESSKLLLSGDLHYSKHLNESFCNNMENNSNTHENFAQVDDELENRNDAAEEEKKEPRKYNFSKHASKMWKSLFKRTKKYSPDVMEYEDIPPEHFIAQRPKVTENKLKIKKWLKKISQSKANDFQNVQDKLFKKLNKIMSSEVTMPLQEVFDIIQKPQFHRDNHSYSGRKKFDRVNTCNYLSNDGHYIMLTEKLNVRGFLVSIGLKDDVAWEAQDNAELNTRLETAINEARSWVNKITMSQGLLIYILAVMTPTEVNSYYLQIVEAIINSRISNVGTLLSVMMVLKRYERGKYGIKTVISRENVRDLVPKQVSETEKRHEDNRSRFIYLYNTAKRAAGKVNKKVDKESAGLLARLTASYSPGLRPYLSLLVHYIAQKVITDKGQLTMAVAYLQSLHIKNFEQETFEQNCGLDQNKVVIRSEAVGPLTLPDKSVKRQSRKHNEKHPVKSNLERIQASWVKQKKAKPSKVRLEKNQSDKSTLERKASTMNLLKVHKKKDA